MQIAPSHKHSIGIFEAQKNNFAKHNEAHKNLPHAYKKMCNEISQNALLLRKISSWELVLYRHTVFSNENRRDFMCFCYHV